MIISTKTTYLMQSTTSVMKLTSTFLNKRNNLIPVPGLKEKVFLVEEVNQGGYTQFFGLTPGFLNTWAGNVH